MADAPSDATASHWCYHCNKRVVVDTLDDFVVCCECDKGFVESIQPLPGVYPSPAPELPLSPDLNLEDSSVGSHFLQMLRLLSHAPSQQSSPPHLDASLPQREGFRIERNRRNEIEVGDEDEEEYDALPEGEGFTIAFNRRSEIEDDDDEQEEEDLSVNEEEEEEEDDIWMRNRRALAIRSGTGEEEEEDDDDIWMRNRGAPAIRSRTGRNRILDWAEILMGIENNSIEFRIESDRYTGNPADYMDDAAGYEALLENLAEGDGGGGRRGAPPAAKSAIEALESFEVSSSEGEMVIVCAVCKDGMVKNETGKKLPCGHCYHTDCIVPWLGTRNSCPVCRFQLQTDDAEYEEDRKKKSTSFTDPAAASSSRRH